MSRSANAWLEVRSILSLGREVGAAGVAGVVDAALGLRVTGAGVLSRVLGKGAISSISLESAAEPNDGKPSKSISHGPIVSRSPLRAGALVNSLPLSNTPLAQRVTTA